MNTITSIEIEGFHISSPWVSKVVLKAALWSQVFIVARELSHFDGPLPIIENFNSNFEAVSFWNPIWTQSYFYILSSPNHNFTCMYFCLLLFNKWKIPRGLKNDLVSLNFPFFEAMTFCIRCPNTISLALNQKISPNEDKKFRATAR